MPLVPTTAYSQAEDTLALACAGRQLGSLDHASRCGGCVQAVTAMGRTSSSTLRWSLSRVTSRS